MKRIDTLDGARGLAALVVALGHFFIETQSFSRESLVFYVSAFTGSASVGLFFILSGFVIPANLERVSLRDFVIRRLFRIYPVVIVAALVKFTILLYHGVLLPDQDAIRALLASTSLFGNLFYWNEKSIEPIFWTVAIEMKFYILAAVVFLAAQRRQERFYPILMALLLSIAALAHHLPIPLRPWISDLGVMVSTLPMLVLGWFAWLWYSSQIGRWNMLLGALCVALALSMTPYPIYVSWTRGAPSWLLAAVLFLMMLTRPGYFHALSSSAGQFLGRISFPLYAVHPAVLWVMQNLRTHVMALDLLLFVAITIALAWLIHRCFETPAIAYSRRLTRRQASNLAPQPLPAA